MLYSRSTAILSEPDYWGAPCRNGIRKGHHSNSDRFVNCSIRYNTACLFFMDPCIPGCIPETVWLY